MSSPADMYAIGAAARLTGVPVETLRTWERRYGVPSPTREDGGRRLYTAEEVERLRLVAELARLGERVRDLAALDRDALLARLDAHRGTARVEPLPSVLRVAVHGGHAAELEGLTPSGLTRVEVATEGPVDVLVYVTEEGTPDVADAVEAERARVGADAVVVVASYLHGAVRRAFADRGVRVVATPRVAELRRAVEDAAIVGRVAAGVLPRAAAPPRFERDELERLMNTRTALACECPNHLASLVLRLRDFEQYSRRCETEGGADAALHRELAEGTAEACARMEALLMRVARHDGLLT